MRRRWLDETMATRHCRENKDDSCIGGKKTKNPKKPPRRGAAADEDDEEEEDGGGGRKPDCAAEAAAEAGDVIVDDYDAVLELMSGLEGGDDGELPDNAVATLYEVAKQAKYLVSPEVRTSVDEYVSLLAGDRSTVQVQEGRTPKRYDVLLYFIITVCPFFYTFIIFIFPNPRVYFTFYHS